MTITSQGYKGSVDEKGWARQQGDRAGWITSGFAVAPVANTRQVTVAPGTAESYGVDVISDAPVPSAVFPAPANGQWYLVALERNWDPAVRATSIVFLPTVASASAATPTAPPAAMPAGFSNTPGTKSHQPLAWAFTSSATTTVTLFDLRLTRTGAGNLAAPTLWAMIVANLAGLLLDGAIVSVLRHTLASGGLHVASRWQRDSVNGYLLPIGTIDVDSTNTAPGTSALIDITNISTVPIAPTIALGVNVRGFDRSNTVEFRMDTLFRPWSCSWRTYQVVTTVVQVSNYLSGFRWRFTDGEVEVRFIGQVNGWSSNQPWAFSLPVAADLGPGSGNDMIWNVKYYAAGPTYQGGVIFRDTGSVWLDYNPPQAQGSGSGTVRHQVDYVSPFGWTTSGCTFEGRLRYSPA